MLTNAAVVATPYYVLMAANHRIGPEFVQIDSGVECTLIYGFSDKGPYDKFWQNSPQTLTPYPLVKVYLRDQVEAAGEGLKLVVVDAAGPDEALVHAATMQAVLEAHESKTTHVAVTYRLTFDPGANAYELEEVSL